MVFAAEMRLMQQRTGALLVLASAVAFGVMPIFGKLAFEAGVGVATLLVVRFAIAAPVLWGAVAVRRVFPRVQRGVLVRALALGAVGYAMQAGLYFLALARMDASVLSLVLYSYPALVTGAAILLGREAANRRRLVALVIASGGLVLVLAGAGAGSLDLAGMALGAGAALTYTTYILVSDGVTVQARGAAPGRAGLHGRGGLIGRRGRRDRARWTSASTLPAGSGSAARRWSPRSRRSCCSSAA